MIDRELFLVYRLWVVRLGIVLSWVALVAVIWSGYRTRGMTDDVVLSTAIGFGAGLFVVTVLPWKRFLRSWLGDAVLIAFAALSIATLGADALLRVEQPLAPAYLGVVVFSAAALIPAWGVALVSVISAAGYALAIDRLGLNIADPDAILTVTIFLLVGVFATLVSIGAGRQSMETARRLDELNLKSGQLEVQRQELDDLYEVSRTIGAGSRLADVMPVLTGRLVEAVHGRVGLVFLYELDSSDLELLSPVWVSGQTVPTDNTRLSLSDPGKIQRVLTTAVGIVENDLEIEDAGDKLLADLEITKIAAVPLRVEQRAIGVLVVGDKRDDDFSDADLSRLEELAAPAALVLNQMSRFEEAQETSERMSELAQLKTDFVSVVSHELRTPLTSIIGALGTVRRPELAPTAPSAVQLLASAERQAHHLKDLIEDLLMVSRLDNQALPVRAADVDLAEAAINVLNAIPEAGHRVAVDMAIDTPQIETDPEHLRRILTNLIVNSIKYGGDSDIELVIRPEGSDVWLSVVDHGDGIPYEKHDQMFQRFTQVQRADTRGKGGTGLGLSIVKGLTDALGGRVWFEPTLGGGATFTVSIPRYARYRTG